MFFPTVNQEVSTRFLEQISQTDPEAVHVILQDRAGFHLRQGAAELPANVRLLPLPAYSPELNPVERVGGLIRTATANRVFVDLPAMEAAIQEALRPLGPIRPASVPSSEKAGCSLK
ncbi:MAG: transposase [Chthoniobacter sp.]